MRIILALSHCVEEAEQLDLLSSLGHEVASIGGYIDPAHPHDPKRPPLPDVPFFPEVKAAIDAIGVSDNLGAAQAHLPDAILDWLGDDGAIIYHHYMDRLYGQWDRVHDWLAGSSGRRVIWRTVGQSVRENEERAQPFRAQGLEIVRYSPQERNIPGFAGEDALIRFWKDAEEWRGWTGDWEVVTNVTQFLKGRDPFTNFRFWEPATEGLPVLPAGPGSDEIGGPGEIPYEDMKELLRGARCYLYCGTQPASYTLGLLEALMTGTPVVSIGPAWFDAFEYGPDMFEGHLLVDGAWSDEPGEAREMLVELLEDEDEAARVGAGGRERAIALFGRDVAARAWREFLG